MFNRNSIQKIVTLEKTLLEQTALVDSIQNHVAYVEFYPDGTILKANSLFLAVVQYEKGDVLGKHHRMFCEDSFSSSMDYQTFWSRLGSGESFSGTFLRITKHGEKIWLDATYFPIYESGKVTKVVKIATDVTQKYNSLQTQLAISEALHLSMAVIEFTPQGGNPLCK